MPLPSDTGTWLAQPMNYWYAALRPFFALYAAPRSLDQSILPWTFAGLVVNENNSSDPATEQAVVTRDSYGRQLGRISDALACLIDTLAEDEKKNKAIEAFLGMKAQIDEIKDKAQAARFDKVLSDLADLRQRDERTFYERVERVSALANSSS